MGVYGQSFHVCNGYMDTERSFVNARATLGDSTMENDGPRLDPLIDPLQDFYGL
jgi:hypothetical protein